MCLGTCHSSLPSVSSGRGKVVSAMLGACHLLILTHMVLGSPWWWIKMRSPSSLIVTRTVTLAQWAAASCGTGIPCAAQKKNRNHGPPSAKTEMATSLVTRTTTEIANRECEKSKKSDNRHSSDWPHGCSPWHKDHDGTYEHRANGKCERLHAHDSPSDSCKTKQRCKVSASPSHSHKKSCTPECRPLLPLPMFHSTPIATPHRLSSDPTSAHLSFNQSRGLLPPIDLGGGNPCPISSVSAPIQAGISSVPGPLPLPSESVSALRLTADHTKEIFNLACKGHQLKEQVTREFAKLSNQEVLFRTQAQSTSYEMLASGCLDCFTAYYMILQSDQESSEAKDKAIEELLNKVSEAWLWANASLFKHVLDYEVKMDTFLDRTGGWIRAQEEHIWMMVVQITKDLRAPSCAGLDIVFCTPGNTPLLSSKPHIPEHLTPHHRVCAQSLCSAALAGAPQPGSCTHPTSRQPQEGWRCFKGGYPPQYRR